MFFPESKHCRWRHRVSPALRNSAAGALIFLALCTAPQSVNPFVAPSCGNPVAAHNDRGTGSSSLTGMVQRTNINSNIKSHGATKERQARQGNRRAFSHAVLRGVGCLTDSRRKVNPAIALIRAVVCILIRIHDAIFSPQHLFKSRLLMSKLRSLMLSLFVLI